MVTPVHEFAPEYKKKLRSVVQQTIKWAHVAQQDMDPMVAIQHYSNALAFLEVAYQLADEQEVSQLAECNAHELKEFLKKKQVRILKQVQKIAPEVFRTEQGNLPSTHWIV